MIIENRGNVSSNIKANVKVEVKNNVILIARIDNARKTTFLWQFYEITHTQDAHLVWYYA